jgi:hypothetical protein
MAAVFGVTPVPFNWPALPGPREGTRRPAQRGSGESIEGQARLLCSFGVCAKIYSVIFAKFSQIA